MDREKTEKQKPLKRREKSGLKICWLLLYNATMAAGWFAIGFSIFKEMVLGNGNYKILYHNAEKLLKIFQTMALFEIFHSASGLVRTSTILTFLHVTSRLLVLWWIINPIVKVQINLGCAMALIGWASTEIIRYSYYAFNLLGFIPYFVCYLRYTIFIPMYPITIIGELLCIYRSIPIVKTTEIFTIHMPNKWNMSFEYSLFLMVQFILYIFIFPQMYFHMFIQRSKALGYKKRVKYYQTDRSSRVKND